MITLKRFIKINRRFWLAPLWLLTLVGLAQARLSLPNNFYYGEALGIEGACLTGNVNAQVIALRDGHVAAKAFIGPFITQNVNYILRLPLDDGWDARFADYATIEGESIQLLIEYDGDQYVVEDFIMPVGPMGTKFKTNIEATPEPTGLLLLSIVLFYFLKCRLYVD